MDQPWWKRSIVYQIYPRSFMDSNQDGIGDLQGIISKLDYLDELGIDVIWLCPVYESPNYDNGYDVSDYKQILSDFGTMEDFDELLALAHQKGIKIIMDLVLNHTSDEHPWFLASQRSKDNAYRNYYIWRQSDPSGKEPNNWRSVFGGSVWEYDDQTKEQYFHLFTTRQPDLNWEEPALRQEIYDIMKWWLDKGIDGFRVDAATYIKKEPGLPNLPCGHGERYVNAMAGYSNRPGIRDFMQEMKEEVLNEYDCMTVAEACWLNPEEAASYVQEEEGFFNMIFQFEHMGVDRGNGKWDSQPWTVPDLKKRMAKWQLGLQGRGWNSLYLENHDQPRSVSRFGDEHTYHQASSKMLATFYMLMQGTPFIYQGQELGMTNVRLPDMESYQDVESHTYVRHARENGVSESDILQNLWRNSRDNARTPMQWDHSEHSGFTKGTPWMSVNSNYEAINVADQLKDPNSILNYYKRLIEIRTKYEVAIFGDFELLDPDHEEIAVYTRSYQDQVLIVVCNFKSGTPKFELANYVQSTQAEQLAGNYDCPIQQIDFSLLQPYECRVYLKS
ncbi:glycosidase [Paenibacillus shirakamiensis]|uniref:Alpha-amylase n=1 Tax=Paenibacillus shirakamiensis TaxID=1265935 RepID=A0ABS4JHP2_9BACL|nr:alpha-glucosidase [Paenibacillus shirakamiensis]MBP2001243.1 glycosidase [Paenibacillus shirakamiensis]